MNLKTIYCSDDETYMSELMAYANDKNQIFMQITNEYDYQHIVLDKLTAIRLVKDLKRQIAFINEMEANNG
jgi:glycine cleavage system regulatory protein